MDDTVNLRGVAVIADLHFKVKQFLNAFHLNRKRGAIGKMIDQGVNLGEINRVVKYFFHIYLRWYYLDGTVSGPFHLYCTLIKMTNVLGL